AVVSELLWFIEGSGDERRLAEIRYGRDRSELVDKRTIWTDNAQAPYWRDKARFEGDLGQVYGVQWRNWETHTRYDSSDELSRLLDAGSGNFLPDPMGTGGVAFRKTDQIKDLIDGLRRDPFGRRHILTAWNPGKLSEMALPPCHVMSQFYIGQGKLSCMLTQRSNDLFLGTPFNVSSYALLVHMLAQVVGLKAGELVHSMGDAHIYSDHIPAVEEQLSRTPRSAPFLYVDPGVKEIDQFNMDSFEIMGYDPHPAIRAKMAV
ncbi:MAG: thymidylate synthase, partial [Oxalobacteraceae bacterium]